MTLKEIRKTKGITQEQAARFLGVPIRTYKRYDSEEITKENIKLNSLANSLQKYSKKPRKSHRFPKFDLTIIGAGFVGYNTGLVYSKRFDITFVDKDENKVKDLKKNFKAVTSIKELTKIDYALICLPTDYNEKTKTFNVKAIETAIKDIFRINKYATVIIKSTVAIGYTEALCHKFHKNIFVMPEFLREKHALEDVKRPVRVIVGAKTITDKLLDFLKVQQECLDIPQHAEIMEPYEAEMIKLYSNAYLAMRVTFFNEMDIKIRQLGLDSKKIINSLGKDERIGNIYNDPSFGYSGYCLPKDVKVLQNQTGSELLKAVDSSNKKRKSDIAKEIVKTAKEIKEDPIVGFYGVDTTKQGKDYRISSTYEIYKKVKAHGITCIIFGENKTKSLNAFKEVCDLIVCNSNMPELKDVKYKVFTRSIK